MTPDTLASLLVANPYPGCVVTVANGAARLNIGEHVLLYRTDGWHYGSYHMECLLSDYSAPEAVHPEIRRALKAVLTLTVGSALSAAQNVRGEDPVAYLTDLAAEKMLAILDVAALANVRKDEIGCLAADLALLKTRTADLERDLAARDASLKTANAALTRVCEVIGADPPCVPDDAVKAVAAQLGADSDAEARASKAEAELREISNALDDAGAPVNYDLNDFDDAEETIPRVNRILILGDYLRAEHRERARAEGDAIEGHVLIQTAHLALDDRNAPRRAAGRALTPAARIRALTR